MTKDGLAIRNIKVDTLNILEVIVASLSIATVVGGVLMRAFINPLKDEVSDLREADSDKETRLRIVETKTTEHDIHISTLVATSERLLTKIDELMGTIRNSLK